MLASSNGHGRFQMYEPTRQSSCGKSMKPYQSLRQKQVHLNHTAPKDLSERVIGI